MLYEGAQATGEGDQGKPQALPCVDPGPRSVKTSMVFLKAKTLKTCRAVNAFLTEISHMDPFPGVSGRGSS